ncbi:hypothetical protein [Curtobacterium poinsettiae]|uniref:hypothetical protein n=1 Tax=Curtobacterium poinsettiae TaxID=159612 RepID=UPI0021C89C35|nr:hypothetical protein [Curtobacterium flaccumfaciens]MCU0115338.1 hypothetical protein [Curtobacterium flaccumfaciens]
MDFDVTVQESFFLADISRRRDTSGRFSKTIDYRSLSSELSLQPKHHVIPRRFVPGNQFKHALLSQSERLGDGNKPPYRVKVDLGGPWGRFEAKAVPRIDQFGPHLFVPAVTYRLRITLKALDDLVVVHSEVQRRLVALGDSDLLRAIAASAAGCKPDQLESGTKRRIHVQAAVGERADSDSSIADSALLETTFARYIAQNRRSIIAQHITHRPDHLPDPRLEAALIKENEQLNLKSESHLLLVNAGGSTIYTIRSDDKDRTALGSVYKNRHVRVISLAQIATVMQHFLLRASPGEISAKTWSTNEHIIERWIRFPSSTLFTSVSNQMIWRAISNAFALESLLDEYERFDGDKPQVGWRT